jgi:hypothetical protein
MATEHQLLAIIRGHMKQNGSHRQHWGELRREVFPGQMAWLSLKAWCAENGFECELVFGQSSKAAEVQFYKHVRTPQMLAPTYAAHAAPTQA